MKLIIKTILISLLICTAVSGRVQSFGIFSPVYGMREDIPSITIPEAFTHDNENVVLRYGEIHRCRMRTEPNSVTVATDGNPVLKYHYFEQADSTDYLVAFTKAHAYHWNSVSLEWDLKYTCSEDCTTWSTVTFNDVLYATNNIDKVQEWSGTGSFSDLGSASGIDVGTTEYLTKATFLCTYEGYLMAGNVTVDGGAQPTTIFWSDTQDADTWNSGNASYITLPGPDSLKATGKVMDFLLVFSGRSIDQLWATDSSLIFNARRLRNNMGTFSPDSIINGPQGELYFMDNRQNIRQVISTAADMQVISRPIDDTAKKIPYSLVSDVRGWWVDSLEQLWWSVPYGPGATENNKLICMDINGAWTKRDMAVSAFGEYEEKTTYTWASVPATATWENWGKIWDSLEAMADYRLDICGDYSGYTYNSHHSSQDNGADFTGYAVVGSDLSHGKGTPIADRYKRLVYMTLLFRNEGSGEADIYLKRDFENEWNSLGSVSLEGDTDILWQRLNADYRGRYFQLKISADDPFRFIGVIFYYTVENLR